MKSDGYKEPIDFLLEMARLQKVDLARLSIVALVDQYVAAAEAPGARATLAERSDWLIATIWLVLRTPSVRAAFQPGAEPVF